MKWPVVAYFACVIGAVVFLVMHDHNGWAAAVLVVGAGFAPTAYGGS